MSKITKLTLEENLKILESAFKTKLTLKTSNEKISCIFHTDSNPSLSVNAYKGLYYCFSCGAKGNTHNLIKLIQSGAI